MRRFIYFIIIATIFAFLMWNTISGSVKVTEEIINEDGYGCVEFFNKYKESKEVCYFEGVIKIENRSLVNFKGKYMIIYDGTDFQRLDLTESNKYKWVISKFDTKDDAMVEVQTKKNIQYQKEKFEKEVKLFNADGSVADSSLKYSKMVVLDNGKVAFKTSENYWTEWDYKYDLLN